MRLFICSSPSSFPSLSLFLIRLLLVRVQIVQCDYGLSLIIHASRHSKDTQTLFSRLPSSQRARSSCLGKRTNHNNACDCLLCRWWCLMWLVAVFATLEGCKCLSYVISWWQTTATLVLVNETKILQLLIFACSVGVNSNYEEFLPSLSSVSIARTYAACYTSSCLFAFLIVSFYHLFSILAGLMDWLSCGTSRPPRRLLLLTLILIE